jgi:two-component system response regulator QseB
MRILLAEDDLMLGKVVKSALENEGNIVDWVVDGELCEAALSTTKFEILILDISMPKKSGLDILKNIRSKKDEQNRLPVLILTAHDAISQKIEGFDLGADDYLVKPFDLNELLVRIKSLVRRSKGIVTSILKIGDVELHDSSHKVLQGGVEIDFLPKEFAVLKILMENPGKVISKAFVEEILYSWESGVESNAVEVHIHNIRKKIGSSFIKTIRGVGYIIEKTSDKNV